MSSRNVHALVAGLQEHPIPTGRELEFSLLGSSVGERFVYKNNADRTPVDLKTALKIVKSQIDAAEKRAESAADDDPAFRFAEITTHPERPYVYALYTELQKLLGLGDSSLKSLRYFNTLDTIVDIQWGTDFFVEVDPAALGEVQFGEKPKTLKEPIHVTVDLTSNPEKSFAKADLVLHYDKLPETVQKCMELGRKAAKRVAKKIAQKLQSHFGSSYQPEILRTLSEAEKLETPVEQHPEIKGIRKGVVKRIRANGPNQTSAN